MTSPLSLGIDFGTTNTGVALADAAGPAHLVKFPACRKASCPPSAAAARPSTPATSPTTAPSRRGPGPSTPMWKTRPRPASSSRSRALPLRKASARPRSSTAAIGLEDLLSTFLLKLRAYADAGMVELPTRVIVGRPVTFAGGSPNESLALSRYETAFERLGFTEILYAYEPVGRGLLLRPRARPRRHRAGGRFRRAAIPGLSIIRLEREAGRNPLDPAWPFRGRRGGRRLRLPDHRPSGRLRRSARARATSSFGKTLPIPNRYYFSDVRAAGISSP